MAKFIYVAVKETDKGRLLGAYSRLSDAHASIKVICEDVRPLFYIRQAFKNGQPYVLLGVANQTLYKLYRFEEK